MPEHHPPHSETERMEIFSDAVIAIVMTIMVLELRPPHEATPAALIPLLPIFLSYILSFAFLGVYWNNHHHLLHATTVIHGSIMWANLHLLFWLTLVPFVTSWVGENPGESWPAAAYGAVLFMAACAYSLLQYAIVSHQGRDSKLARALGSDLKGKISLVCYAAAIPGAFLHVWIAYGLFVLVALLWTVPDKRLAPMFNHDDD